MIDYCKYVLEKFAFSSRLFRKEYKKCLILLEPAVHLDFKSWVRSRFAAKASVEQRNN